MYNLGRIKEYQPDHGFGFVTVLESNENIFFEIADFPSHGGLPRKGENVKFIIVQNQGKLKASKFIRLDQAVHHSLKKSQQRFKTRYDPVQQNRKTARKVLAWVSLLLLGAIVGGYYGWNAFQEYQTEQNFKLNLYTQQQNDIVIDQRKAVGHVKDVHFSEQSRAALNETSEESINHMERVATKSPSSSKSERKHLQQSTQIKERPSADVRITSGLIQRSNAVESGSN